MTSDRWSLWSCRFTSPWRDGQVWSYTRSQASGLAHHAAVDHVGCPGDVGRMVGCQENSEIGNLLGLSPAVKWNLRENLLIELGVRLHIGVDGGKDGAGG